MLPNALCVFIFAFFVFLHSTKTWVIGIRMSIQFYFNQKHKLSFTLSFPSSTRHRWRICLRDQAVRKYLIRLQLELWFRAAPLSVPNRRSISRQQWRRTICWYKPGPWDRHYQLCKSNWCHHSLTTFEFLTAWIKPINNQFLVHNSIISIDSAYSLFVNFLLFSSRAGTTVVWWFYRFVLNLCKLMRYSLIIGNSVLSKYTPTP